MTLGRSLLLNQTLDPQVVVGAVVVGVVADPLVVKYNVGDRCGDRTSLCDVDTVSSPNIFQKGVSHYTFVFGRHPRSPKVCCNIIGAG